MAESGTTTFIALVLFVACGLMFVIVLIIFIKRQIARFAFLSKYEPHIPIGSSISRFFKRDIMTRLNKTRSVVHTPTLHSEEYSDYIEAIPHSHRVKAMDLMNRLDSQIQQHSAQTPSKQGHSKATTDKVNGADMQELKGLYKKARRNPQKFTKDQYDRCECLSDAILKRLNAPLAEGATLPGAGQSSGSSSANPAALLSITLEPFKRLARFTKKKTSGRGTANQYEAVPNEEC